MSGQRRPIRVRVITDAELENQILLRDAKAFLSHIAIPRRQAVDWLYTQFGMTEVELLDELNNPVQILELSPLDKQHFDLWYREWIKLPERHIQLRIRHEARERIRLLLTLMRMIFPKETAAWGRPEMFFRMMPNTHWAE